MGKGCTLTCIKNFFKVTVKHKVDVLSKLHQKFFF